MVDAVLIFPPAYYPWFVPPGLSYLTAYVRQAGFSVVQRDANVPAIEFNLSPRRLRAASAPEELIARIGPALEEIRNADAYKNFWPYLKAKAAIEEASEFVNTNSDDTFRIYRNTFQYISKFDARNREDIIRAVERREESIFFEYFSSVEVPEIERLAPRLVGFSINDHHQLIPSYILASMLKDQLPTVHICFGGNLIARILSTLEREDELSRRLFTYVDSYIHHEGEQPLVALLKKLCSGATAGAVLPQIVQHDGKAVVSGSRSRPIALVDLPLPDSAPYRPWTPTPVIPLNVYRGCYHSGVCTFCDINEGYDSIRHENRQDGSAVVKFTKRLRPMEIVAKDMDMLSRQHETSIFSFTDEWFRVQEMLELGHHLTKHNKEFHWEAYARFEKAYLKQEKCDAIRAAGGRFLQFGLESIAPQTLKQMRKGNTPDEYAKILSNTTKAGIWNHVFFIVGYPGEPIHHVLPLFVFLTRHAQNVLTIKPTRFQLARRAPLIYQPPPSIMTMPENEWDFYINIPFQYRQEWWCPRCKAAIDDALITYKRHRGKCGGCGSYLEKWSLLSRKGVDAIYILSEILCERHWAHPVTSLYPYVSRLFLSEGDSSRYRCGLHHQPPILHSSKRKHSACASS